jgi:small-conductance mechanosensitive channel
VLVGVKYGIDPQNVREILLDIVKKREDVLDSPAPIHIKNVSSRVFEHRICKIMLSLIKIFQRAEARCLP